jgi:hypothetical protein
MKRAWSSDYTAGLIMEISLLKSFFTQSHTAFSIEGWAFHFD